jgi:MFS family permease
VLCSGLLFIFIFWANDFQYSCKSYVSCGPIKFFSAMAQSVQTMIIGRLLAGIGIGISSAIVPLYISEVVTYFIFIRSL